MLSVTRRGAMCEILIRLDDPSGTTFSLREVDCRAMTSRYLGTDDTPREEGRQGGGEPPRAFFPGSISDVVSRHACRS